MNFLAHLYLSGESDEVKIGNFIGDWVKGHDYIHFPETIKKGILLHREIDFFTDNHIIVKKSKANFYNMYHKYSGIIVDIFYDHYLAKNWSHYSNEPLNEFLGSFYKNLLANYDILPEKLQNFIPGFIKRGWMSKYEEIEGIQSVLNAMAANSHLPDNISMASDILVNRYDVLEDEFTRFFAELMEFVSDKYKISITLPNA